MELFKTIGAQLAEGAKAHIVIQKIGDDRFLTSVAYDDPSVKESKKNLLLPFVLGPATAADLDGSFVEKIGEPLAISKTVNDNLKAMEASAKAATAKPSASKNGSGNAKSAYVTPVKFNLNMTNGKGCQEKKDWDGAIKAFKAALAVKDLSAEDRKKAEEALKYCQRMKSPSMFGYDDDDDEEDTQSTAETPTETEAAGNEEEKPEDEDSGYNPDPEDDDFDDDFEDNDNED